jgi:cell division protein FtsQ
VVVFVAAIHLNRYFVVNNIQVVGLSSESLIRGLDLVKNQNIFFVDEKELEKRLLDENSIIKKIVIKKILPNKIIITIESHAPLAVLVVNNGYLYLGQNGRVLAKKKQNDTDLAIINYYQKFDYVSSHIGNWISNKDIIISLNLLKACVDLELKINSIDISSLDMLGFNLDGKKLLFTTEKPVETQAYILEKVVGQFKIEGKDFKSLDLRFDKPVIVLKDS